MNKVYALAPKENWIVDQLVKDWNTYNIDITSDDSHNASVIWLYADWCWQQLPRELLASKKVVTTVHHIVPEKFGPQQVYEFQQRDKLTTVYHVPNRYTEAFIRPLTTKQIHVIPYWANNHIWQPTGTMGDLRKKHGLSEAAYLIGSFQRDTEGHDLKTPKLEKGPDLLADAIIKYRDRCLPHFTTEVVLAGWRRQYLMRRLDEASVKYHYFELPTQSTINELYQCLNLYPVTARQEGGPQALIEAGLLNVPVVSRPVGIAEIVLPSSAINDDVTEATPHIPNVEVLKLPLGFQPYRRLFEEL